MSASDSPPSLLGRSIDPQTALPQTLRDHRDRLLAARQAFPHALLLAGYEGAGVEGLASALAAGLLCDRPDTAGRACGGCKACRLMAAGNHPDLFWLSPAEADESAGRKASRQIRIEAVRQLIAALALSPHHGAVRVSVIEPAEAMNPATANALLKVLEEPPVGNVLLLISHRPLRLLPTLRSRCLQVRVASEWSAATLAEGVDVDLAHFLRDPAPDAAAHAVWPAQRALLDALAHDRRIGIPVASRINGLTLPAAMQALSRWVYDLARVQAGGNPRFLPARWAALRTVAVQADRLGLLHIGRRLSEWQRHADHPLVAGLTVADILLEYRAELFPPARNAA